MTETFRAGTGVTCDITIDYNEDYSWLYTKITPNTKTQESKTNG